MRTFTLSGVALLLAALMASPGARAQAPSLPANHAIVIGINEYVARDVETLKYAVADAEEIARILKRSGYKTIPLLEHLARREQILMQLGRLASVAKEEDSVLIYFAGHGVRQKLPLSNNSFWFTYDSSLSMLESSGIRISHLMDYINEIPARRKIVILDHCHSWEVNEAFPGAGARAGVAGRRNLYSFEKDNFRKEVSTRGADGLIVFAASRDNAFEVSELGHGLFTHLLLKAMSDTVADTNGDGRVSVRELEQYMEEQFVKAAKAKNVRQDSVTFVHGIDLNWPLVNVGKSTRELGPMLDKLKQDGNLGVGDATRCLQAMKSWEEAVGRGAEPNPRDAALVTHLKQIHDLKEDYSARDRVKLIESFLKEAGPL